MAAPSCVVCDQEIKPRKHRLQCTVCTNFAHRTCLAPVSSSEFSQMKNSWKCDRCTAPKFSSSQGPMGRDMRAAEDIHRPSVDAQKEAFYASKTAVVAPSCVVCDQEIKPRKHRLQCTVCTNFAHRTCLLPGSSSEFSQMKNSWKGDRCAAPKFSSSQGPMGRNIRAADDIQRPNVDAQPTKYGTSGPKTNEQLQQGALRIGQKYLIRPKATGESTKGKAESDQTGKATGDEEEKKAFEECQEKKASGGKEGDSEPTKDNNGDNNDSCGNNELNGFQLHGSNVNQGGEDEARDEGNNGLQLNSHSRVSGRDRKRKASIALTVVAKKPKLLKVKLGSVKSAVERRGKFVRRKNKLLKRTSGIFNKL